MTDNPHYVTPEEAEKMGCCMSMNRPEFAASCIGKTCMAWRWEMKPSMLINWLQPNINRTRNHTGLGLATILIKMQ